ncbi:MAG: hypothetical protein BECKG1743D_GA0114223_103534 [Candidatus Kentron sp. G]|nr:MAG: hypothetical protein BECKG1743D_GA0114223_103534 [Candidatus Kentron sp. G]VFN05119.1 MAG: hypothetical protein BECKG1743F_GA0114225_110283 [Candidatus Kentron sp. G]VFN05312.1 MAG: hypothetical protein BECKG1743E_GA0114224_108484 [Candidatus Kentron sp. G]
MTEQTRRVFDTNTLISRLPTPGGVAAKAVDHGLASGILLVSEDTMNELARVLDRPKFDSYISREDRRRFIELLGGVARIYHGWWGFVGAGSLSWCVDYHTNRVPGLGRDMNPGQPNDNFPDW